MEEKIKIDIITMHAVQNYGSVLQTYATQKIFEGLGAEVRIIDYIREEYKYENLATSWGKGNRIKEFVMKPTIKRWKTVFRVFCQEHLILTDKTYTTYEDFNNFPLESDAYCTGSDQVWNSVWNRGILPMLYLNFVPSSNYKFAFGASFGQEHLSKDEVDKTKPFINQYRHISVREDSAVKILKEQYGYKNVIQTIDPTLCFTPEQWRCVEEPISIKGNYILIYNLNRSKAFDEYAVNLSKKTGLKLVRLCTRYDQFYRPGKSVFIPTIFQFVSLIDHAKYVLTDSFHATAFATNMNTEPICIYPHEFGGRIESFLKLVDSEQRHVRGYDDFDVLNRHMDFTRVNSILDSERNKAIDYLNMVFDEIRDFKK